MKKKRFDLLDNRVAGWLGIRVRAEHVQGLKDKMGGMVQAALDKDELWEDGAYMDDIKQATLRGAHPAATLLLYALSAFLVFFILWANFAQIDQRAMAQGKVIPSGNVQAVGSPEGGVVAEIFVKAGDIVRPDQPLVRLDDSYAAAELGDKEQRSAYLIANVARLQAEVDGTDLVFSDEFTAASPEIVSATRALFNNRTEELKSSLAVFAEQVEQRKQEVSDAKRTYTSLSQAARLASEELSLARPAFEQGAIPRSDIVRLELSAVEAKRQASTAQISIPQAEAALREAQQKLKEGELQFKNQARAELADMTDELARLSTTKGADAGRVERALLKSPIMAEVKDVLVNTIGQAVPPNTNIVELVPLEETLLIEIEMKPADIAFIRPGQPAVVKLTAYDFGIYGGLDGVVERVSGDSFVNEKKETFFKVWVKTDSNTLSNNGDELPIKSGMVASVDILTGKRSIMHYLLKPINKAMGRALSEK